MGETYRAFLIKLEDEDFQLFLPIMDKMRHPILDTRISVCSCVRVFVCSCVTLRGPPLDSETGWTGELWSNPVLLILEN